MLFIVHIEHCNILHSPPEGPPGQPSNLKTSNIGASSITVTWNKPINGSSAIDGYNVQWQVEGESDSQATYVPTEQATLSVRPYTRYTIKVQAKNNISEGTWSPEIKVQTAETSGLISVQNKIMLKCTYINPKFVLYFSY